MVFGLAINMAFSPPVPIPNISYSELMQRLNVHHGVVSRRCDKLFKFVQWSHVRLVLSDGCLYMYDLKHVSKPKIAISLYGYHKVSVLKEGPEKRLNECTFKLEAVQPTMHDYIFSTPLTSDMEQWKAKLEAAIQSVNGSTFGSHKVSRSVSAPTPPSQPKPPPARHVVSQVDMPLVEYSEVEDNNNGAGTSSVTHQSPAHDESPYELVSDPPAISAKPMQANTGHRKPQKPKFPAPEPPADDEQYIQATSEQIKSQRTSTALPQAHLYYQNVGLQGEKSSAHVTGSDVTGSDVTGSDVTGSDVTGSDVTGSNVTGSDVTGNAAAGSHVTGSATLESPSKRRHSVLNTPRTTAPSPPPKPWHASCMQLSDGRRSPDGEALTPEEAEHAPYMDMTVEQEEKEWDDIFWPRERGAEACSRRLKDIGKNGVYAVRKGESHDAYNLCVLVGKEIVKYKIDEQHGQFSIGKTSKQWFPSVPALVENFKTESLPNREGNVLTKPYTKS